ncbi:MAG: glutamate synthase-related protein [Candidatus Zixiibacteriota bacterium]
MPFSREKRSIIYQRSKCALDTLPFGAQRDVYATGYEWVNHSLLATRVLHESLRIRIGGPDCERPYSASPLNISAMSYGALSKNAILALGADVLYAARAMMLSLGCIQALRCNANICPTGIATQDANLIAGLHVLPSAGWFTCITKRR